MVSFVWTRRPAGTTDAARTLDRRRVIEGKLRNLGAQLALLPDSHRARARGRRRRASKVPLNATCKLNFSPQNALDTTLAWGDILTLTATEVSSDRVPLSQVGMLCSVLVLAWVGTASAKGDYRYKAASNQVLFGQHQQIMGLAAINSSTTWVMFVPVALACYASLVSHGLMPKTTFAASAHPGELPAQLEVLVAALFTVSSWRGIYAGLRPFI